MKTQLVNNVNTQKKKLYIIIGIALITLIAVAIAVIFVMNSNKDVKDLYFQTEIKNFVNSMDELKKIQDDSITRNKPFRENPSRTRYELSAKLSKTDNSNSSNNTNSNNTEGFINIPTQAVDIINSTKLILNSRYDIKKDINMSSLSFLLEGQSFIDINTLFQGDTIGLQLPIIYDKYFIMDKNNVSEALSKFGLDIPIKSIFSISQLQAATTFSIEDSKNIFIDYLKFLQENISIENISMSKNVKLQELKYPSIVSVNPEEAKKTGKYNIFSIKLSEEEFKPIAIKTVDVLCSDSRFVDMTIGNLTSILNIIEEAGYLNMASSIESAVKNINNLKDIESLKTELTGIINNTAFPDGFNMTLVVDPSGNLADRKISLSSKTMNEPVRKYSMQTGKFFTKTTIEQESARDSDGNALIEFEKVRKGTTGDMYVHISCLNNMWSDFDLTVDSSSQNSKDDKRKSLNTNYLVDIRLTARDLGFDNANILLDLKREDRYGIEFSMPELNNETSINLNNSAKEQVDALMMDLQFSAAKFLLGNQSILNSFTSEQ